MSVYKNSVYRDNAFQWLCRHVPFQLQDNPFCNSLANFNVEEFGDFPVPPKVKPGNLEKQFTHKDPEQRVARADISTTQKPQVCKPLAFLVQTLPRAKIGLQSIYNFVGKYHNRIFRELPDRRRDDGQESFNKFAATIYTLGAAASAHTPADVLLRAARLPEEYNTEFANPRDFIRALWTIKATASSRKSFRTVQYQTISNEPLTPIPIQKRDQHFFKGIDIYAWKGGYIFVPAHTIYCYFFTNIDIDRLERLINGFATCRFAPYEENNYTRDEVRQYHRAVVAYQEVMFEAMARVTYDQAQLLCRCGDVAYTNYLASLATDVNNRAKNDQLAKWYKEGLSDIISLNQLLGTVTDLPMNAKMQVLLQYKAFPQPDFDYFGAMERQRKLYADRAAVANASRAANNPIFQDVLKYHKWLMIVTFYQIHKRCPGGVSDTVPEKQWHEVYPNCHPSKVPYEDSYDIDFRGEFDWIFRTTDVVDMLKDKAICAEQINNCKDSYEYRQLPVSEKNYLMNWLSNPEPPDLETLNSQRETLNYDVKAEDKPEAKKPNGRWFFEAAVNPRLLQSQYEGSVAYYCKHCPGSTNGISISDKSRKQAQLTSRLPEDSQYKELFKSFDIDKFSPTLPVTVHQELDKQWAEAFGVPELKEAHRIFTQGNIHYIKGRIHHTMPKTGADFEGFSGRKLTMYHAAVMGYCVRGLKKRKVIEGPAGFACLIDDGLLRLNIVRSQFAKNSAEAIEYIDNVYTSCALLISWDKTYVSNNFAYYLNEATWKGRSIQPALRAVLKITSTTDAIVPSMLGELQHLESTCRGSIASGAPLMLAYALYSWHATDVIRKWGVRFDKEREKLDDRQAVQAFFPVQLGGLGLTTALLMAGSVTQNAVQEGLGALRMMSIVFPVLHERIEAGLNCELEAISERNACVDPMYLKIVAPTLKTTRVAKLIKRHIGTIVKNPVMVEVLDSSEDPNADFLLMLVRRNAKLPIELRDSIKRCGVEYAVDTLINKFLLSSTAQSFVPRRALARIGHANVTEAGVVTKIFWRK